jgi:hypothetical protein
LEHALIESINITKYKIMPKSEDGDASDSESSTSGLSSNTSAGAPTRARTVALRGTLKTQAGLTAIRISAELLERNFITADKRYDVQRFLDEEKLINAADITFTNIPGFMTDVPVMSYVTRKCVGCAKDRMKENVCIIELDTDIAPDVDCTECGRRMCEECAKRMDRLCRRCTRDAKRKEFEKNKKRRTHRKRSRSRDK